MSTDNSSKVERFISANKNTIGALMTIISVSFTAGVMYDAFKTGVKNMPREVVEEMMRRMGEMDKRLEVHVTVDRSEKEALNRRMDELSKRVDELFLKPEEPEVKGNKKAPE